MDERQQYHSWIVSWKGLLSPMPSDQGVVCWINATSRSTLISSYHDLCVTQRHVPYLGTSDRQVLIATIHEVHRWNIAASVCMSAVVAAADALIVAQRRYKYVRWLSILSKRFTAKMDRAQRHYLDRIRAAAQAYQPFYAELVQRRADSAAELQEQARLTREQHQAYLRRLQEEEQARRAVKEEAAHRKQAAFAAEAARCVWGYIVEAANSRRVYVFRHDVPPRTPIPEAGQRSEQPLTAQQLAVVLDELLTHGADKIRWDEAARHAVEEVIGAGLFAEWWRQLDHEANPHRSPRRPSGTSHHSSYTDGSGHDGGGGHSGCGHG